MMFSREGPCSCVVPFLRRPHVLSVATCVGGDSVCLLDLELPALLTSCLQLTKLLIRIFCFSLMQESL